MLKPSLSILPLALLAASCATPPPATAPELGGSCRPVDQSRYVGREGSSALGAELMRESGARLLRWAPHGSMMTMEFSPDRLTVRLDAQNRVEAANCG